MEKNFCYLSEIVIMAEVLTEEEVDKIAIVDQRHTLTVRSFYSQLAIVCENDLFRSNKKLKRKKPKDKRLQPQWTPLLKRELLVL